MANDWSRRGDDCAKTDPVSAAYAGLGAEPRMVTSNWNGHHPGCDTDAVQILYSSTVIAECDYIPLVTVIVVV